MVDPAYQSPLEGDYTELQTHDYAKLQVNKQEEVEEVEKDDNKQYVNTEAQNEDKHSGDYNKQDENNQYELANCEYINVA